ncbi:membrane protein [Algibacter mikhailovii]|uniref:Membrane protein n=1 Tax=Algibacter mikhailovii TaxID=425498 RepID=A0A918R8V3_9FLAO|nr:membrane protein [Algibacter mikhailovii]
MFTQDISVTQSLVTVVMETKPSIVFDLLSVQYIVYIVFVLNVLFFVNRYYARIKPIEIKWIFVVISLISISSYSFIEKRRNGTLRSRLPYSVFFGFNDYFEKPNYVLAQAPKEINSPIDSLKVILVLGETVRADHLGINGYKRQTTPLISKIKNIVSFQNIYTPHTYTGSSLPRIISSASINTNPLNKLVSVYDVYNSCNFNTVWFGNQELEVSYESLVKTNKAVVLVDSLRSVYSFNKVLDENLLPPFKKEIIKKQRGLYSLHMIGSHWWYENRYRDIFRVFQPVMDSKHIPSLEAEQIINSYDNTILYLDFFLNSIIGSLDNIDEPVVLIYISDHGEALGENGKWLHAQDIDACKNPAMLVWYSEAYRKLYPDKIEALKKNKEKVFSTDVIYHSLLDLIKVEGMDYKNNLSVFRSLN